MHAVKHTDIFHSLSSVTAVFSDKNLKVFKVKKREKGSWIRMATGRVKNIEVEGRKKRKVSRKEGRKKKEGMELSLRKIIWQLQRRPTEFLQDITPVMYLHLIPNLRQLCKWLTAFILGGEQIAITNLGFESRD
jgi:hypothetical protein